MEKPVLSDPGIFPSGEVLLKFLKNANPAFLSLFRYNHENFPEFEERWKYYNDGKSWLMNVSKKKKTLFWLSIGNGFFKTTFYLNQKASETVRNSNLTLELKKAFEDKMGKKFIGLTAEISTKKDIETYKELLKIKMGTM